jgi:hypothetical protein
MIVTCEGLLIDGFTVNVHATGQGVPLHLIRALVSHPREASNQQDTDRRNEKVLRECYRLLSYLRGFLPLMFFVHSSEDCNTWTLFNFSLSLSVMPTFSAH